MRKAGRRYIHETEELNITAFMNLMVALIPFLLVSAVFSRMTVLELNLPAPGAEEMQKPEALAFEVVLRADRVDIQEPRLGLIKRIEHSQGNVQWAQLREVLLELKRRYPEERDIVLLLEPNVQYKSLIQTMDYVRSAEVSQGLGTATVELFPNIAIGDASIVKAGE